MDRIDPRDKELARDVLEVVARGPGSVGAVNVKSVGGGDLNGHIVKGVVVVGASVGGEREAVG